MMMTMTIMIETDRSRLNCSVNDEELCTSDDIISAGTTT